MVEEHKPALLECIVIGTPMPEVKWYRGEEELKPEKGREITFNPETGEAKLHILEPTEEDETIYRVRAVNKFGRAECRANLVISNVVRVSKPEVLRAPKITRPLPALVAEFGKSLTLSADFESKPTPEVKWYRNGAEIVPSDKRVIKIYENTTELYIPEVTKKDGGKYEVRVENPVGEARSSGSVTVKEREDKTDEVKAPRFIEPLQPQIVTEGEVVIMETRVDSYPAASFQWFHDTRPLEVFQIFFSLINFFYFLIFLLFTKFLYTYNSSSLEFIYFIYNNTFINLQKCCIINNEKFFLISMYKISMYKHDITKRYLI